MDIRSIEQLNDEQRRQTLQTVPPPDRYILLSSSNSMTNEQLTELYAQTKQKADNAQTNIDSTPIDTKSAEFIDFAKRYTTQVIDMLMNDPSIAKEGQMSFILGSPGAGKSSVIRTEKEKLGAWHANADEIKEAIHKELGIDINHPEIHKASGEIMKNYVIPALLENKINFLQEKIGDEIGKMIKYTESYIEQGFEVSVTLVHCDFNVCRQRNCNRCLDSIEKGEAPRLVEDNAICGYANSPMETYLYLMNNVGHLFARGSAYCSDGPDRHTPPQALESLSFEKGERVMNPWVQEYINQGQQLKYDAMKLSAKKVIEVLQQANKTELANEVYTAVKEFIETGIVSHSSDELNKCLSIINENANKLLISVLNPSKNVRSIGENFNIESIHEKMLAEIAILKINNLDEFTDPHSPGTM